MHLTRRIPNILLAAVTAAAYIWACFAANFAEQFVCLNSAAAVLGSAARWIASAGFIALPAALLYGEQRCRAAAICAARGPSGGCFARSSRRIASLAAAKYRSLWK